MAFLIVNFDLINEEWFAFWVLTEYFEFDVSISYIIYSREIESLQIWKKNTKENTLLSHIPGHADHTTEFLSNYDLYSQYKAARPLVPDENGSIHVQV